MLHRFLLIGLLLPAALWAAVTVERKMDSFIPGKRGTVLIFVSSMCPCTDQHKSEIKQLMSVTQSRGIAYYCVFSNITENDSRIGQFYRNIGWEMPYIHDREGRLAKRHGASHTPQVVLLDNEGRQVYRGPIDDSNRNLGRIEHAYLREHVQTLLENGTQAFSEVQPTGCWLVTAADVQK